MAGLNPSSSNLPFSSPVKLSSSPTSSENSSEKKQVKKDDSSLRTRLFAVLNSIEKSNEAGKETPVPAYVKWGLPLLVTTQIATLTLLAFNLKEMADLRSGQRNIKNMVEKIEKELLSGNTLQDFLNLGEQLISGATMKNSDLQPLSNALKALKNTVDPKKAINTVTGLVDSVQKNKGFLQGTATFITCGLNVLGFPSRLVSGLFGRK